MTIDASPLATAKQQALPQSYRRKTFDRAMIK
jgi:hypothetical protein